MMKRIKYHAENLLDKTRLLEHHTLTTKCRKTFDVANLMKVQLEEMMRGKPSSTNPKRRQKNTQLCHLGMGGGGSTVTNQHQRLKNNKLYELLKGNSSGQSPMETIVKKQFDDGWFQGFLSLISGKMKIYTTLNTSTMTPRIFSITISKNKLM